MDLFESYVFLREDNNKRNETNKNYFKLFQPQLQTTFAPASFD